MTSSHRNQDPEYLELLNQLRQNSKLGAEKTKINIALSSGLAELEATVIPDNEPVLKQILDWLTQASKKGYSGIKVKLNPGFYKWNSSYITSEEKESLPLYCDEELIQTLKSLGLNTEGETELGNEYTLTIFGGDTAYIYNNPDEDSGCFNIDSCKLNKKTLGTEVYSLFKRIINQILFYYDGYNSGICFSILEEFKNEIYPYLQNIPNLQVSEEEIKEDDVELKSKKNNDDNENSENSTSDKKHSLISIIFSNVDIEENTNLTLKRVYV